MYILRVVNQLIVWQFFNCLAFPAATSLLVLYDKGVLWPSANILYVHLVPVK